ncbi:MAG: amino acid aminotransferase [Pseudomonadota bacterium]|nr:amino acid aminotransferase [Pseudomonadota bacterium]
MFEALTAPAADPILGLITAFRDDPAPGKIDLGVGVYKDQRGMTGVMEVVKAAERRLVNEQESKAYLGPAGNESFNEAIAALVLGENHAALRDGRVRSMQAPGGCGALRLGAELVQRASAATTVLVSDPTWANHIPLMAGAGLTVGTYPYYDVATGQVRFEQMVERLRALDRGSVVLIHGACHNPTGMDLTLPQWRALAEVLNQRGLIPFVDIAYQGLGAGIDEDAAGVRLLAEELPEVLIAISCSKNFGLYRERVGSLIVVGQSRPHAAAAAATIAQVARGIYSMPPDHGAAVVSMILGDAALASQWRQELAVIRDRIFRLRNAFSEALSLACPGQDFSWIVRQRGMFSVLNLAPQSVTRLRERQHIYMTGDGRVNISGLRESGIDYVARSVADELRESSAARTARP